MERKNFETKINKNSSGAERKDSRGDGDHTPHTHTHIHAAVHTDNTSHTPEGDKHNARLRKTHHHQQTGSKALLSYILSS